MSIQAGILLLALLTLDVCNAGNLIILHKPDYVQLTQADGSLKLSQLQHVISEWFGFTTHKEVDYNGLLSSQPFSHPEAVAVVSLFNGLHLLEQLGGSKISTVDDEVYIPTHNLEHRLNDFYHTRTNTYKLDLDTKVRDMDGRLEGLNDDEQLIKANLKELFNMPDMDSQDMELQHFLKQISLTAQALDKVGGYERGAADLYSFELAMPSDSNDNVQTTLDKAVRNLLKRMEDRLKREYGDNYILMVVSWNEKHSISSRKSRSLMEADTEATATTPQPSTGPTKKSLNVSDDYSSDYAAMFNIILWLTVILALLVIYVVYGMMSMDPGSDSIIYRMTTTRLKKD